MGHTQCHAGESIPNKAEDNNEVRVGTSEGILNPKSLPAIASLLAQARRAGTIRNPKSHIIFLE